MVNFLIWISWLWLSQSCSFGYMCFFWRYYLFHSGFLSFGKFWSFCCLGFHVLSIKLKRGCFFLSHSLLLFSCSLGQSSWSFERWENIFNFVACTTAPEFCEWFQFGIDVNSSHCKYQVKPQNPWFSAYAYANFPETTTQKRYICCTSSIQWPRDVVFCIS